MRVLSRACFLGTCTWIPGRWGVGITRKPTKAQWINPSLTTFGVEHSSFRVFEANSASYEVENYYQYRLNQTRANENPTLIPSWEVAYDFKSLYEVSDMSAESIYELALKIGSNESLALTYRMNTGNPDYESNECDEECLRKIMCRMISAVYDDGSNCIGFPEGITEKVIDIIFGDWTYKVYSQLVKVGIR